MRQRALKVSAAPLRRCAPPYRPLPKTPQRIAQPAQSVRPKKPPKVPRYVPFHVRAVRTMEPEVRNILQQRQKLPIIPAPRRFGIRPRLR